MRHALMFINLYLYLFVDCEVGDWGEYGDCSTTCGAGISSRTRDVLVVPDSGGEKCPNLLDTQPCFQPPCPDGKTLFSLNELKLYLVEQVRFIHTSLIPKLRCKFLIQ